MATSPANVNRLFDGGINFMLGMNSNLEPDLLNPAQTSWQINVTNKGAILGNRPGFKTVLRLPDGKAQGFASFTPTGGVPHLVSAINGVIYVSEYPFTSYMALSNVQFDPFAEQVVFKVAIQAFDGVSIIDPKAVLMMQDGAGKAAYWDGFNNRHLNPGGQTNETVQGLWMEWIGSRLWVARGRQLFASDIYDPLHFTETLYLSGGGSLNAMDGEPITGLAKTSDNRSLLVFTLTNTTIVKAGITDRTLWQTTPDFISLLFPGVGLIAGKSITYLNGELWWYSIQGVRRYTQVGAAILSSRNLVSSIEMKRSFENISKNVQYKVAGMSSQNYVGFSTPSGDIFNRHTWVLDYSLNSQLTSESPPSWEGVWMGTRPVEWANAVTDGSDRTFYLSQDYCGVRIWELDYKDRTDNGGRIYCSVEFPGLSFKESSSFKRFMYSEFFLRDVSGNVSITVDYRGDWGCWKRLADINLCAKDCFDVINCFGSNSTIMPQNRYFKTQEALHSCQSVEGTYSEDIGSSFQNRIRWYGKNKVRQYRSSAHQFQERATGECALSDATCKVLECCDPELTYVSHVDDCGYGYGSSSGVCCLI